VRYIGPIGNDHGVALILWLLLLFHLPLLPRQHLVGFADPVQLLVVHLLQIEQCVVGRPDRTYDLVQLDL